MTTYDEALGAVLGAARALGAHSVPLAEAVGRCVASDLVAQFDSPMFDNSAVDGFAVRSVELISLPVSLRVATDVYAGDDPLRAICNPGTCVRTMTGAPIAQGADAVVMKEDVVLSDGTATFALPVTSGHMVRRRGEEFKKGDLLVKRGTVVTPPVLALFASQGCTSVSVHRAPRVGIVATGDELARPGSALGPGQIYESNSYALSAAASSLTRHSLGTVSVGDDRDATKRALLSLLGECEVIVVSGGASVGEKDFVREVCLQNGVREVFWRVAMKPGKPVFFGIHENGALVFGLPGNPVSSQVVFEVLVAPAIRKMCGHDRPVKPLESVVLGSCIKRSPGRREFLRAKTRIERGRVIAEPVERQGSHMASGIAEADRLIVVPADADCIEAGSLVDSIPLGWTQ